MYDRTGGPLVYAREAMGKTVGFTVGWMVWIAPPVRQLTTEPPESRRGLLGNSRHSKGESGFVGTLLRSRLLLLDMPRKIPRCSVSGPFSKSLRSARLLCPNTL
jgi:hypothetical protein